MKSQYVERFDREPRSKVRSSRRVKPSQCDDIVIELDTMFDRSTEQSTIQTSGFPFLFLGTLAPDLDAHLRMMDLGFDDEVEERPVNRKADEYRTIAIRKMSRLASSSSIQKEDLLPIQTEPIPLQPVPPPDPPAKPPESEYREWSEEVAKNLNNFQYLLELELEEEGWSKRVQKSFATIALKIVLAS